MNEDFLKLCGKAFRFAVKMWVFLGLALSCNFFYCLFLFQFDEVKSKGVIDIDTRRPLPSTVHSMNAYLGYEYFNSSALLNYCPLSPGHFQ